MSNARKDAVMMSQASAIGPTVNVTNLRVIAKHVGLSKSSGFPPKSSILIGFSVINHPFWGPPLFWKHPCVEQELLSPQKTNMTGLENPP